MASRKPKISSCSEDLAPDPATTYERAKPEREAGLGRLDSNQGTPCQGPDGIEDAVRHRQRCRQLNADDVVKAAEERQADGERLRADLPRPDAFDIENE
jgi:hypothetical protein